MKRIFSIVLVMLVVFLAACSPSSSPTTKPPGVVTAPTPSVPGVAPQPAPAPTPPALPPFADRGDAAVSESQGGSGVAAGLPIVDQMIVRTGNLALVVDDVPASIDQISALADRLDGIVVSSNVYLQDKNRLFGNISIRVPVERFDEAIKSLRSLASDVASETTDSRDVTEEYTDLGSRLKNLEAAETQLRAILAKAEKVEDILAVQRELTNIRGQIEQTRGRMQFLERTSATSLISISLQQSKLAIEFTADRRTAKDGEEIYFAASISGGFPPYSYEWSLGDGAKSTEAVFLHSYRRAGDYTVTLTVTDDRGKKETLTRTNYITVIPGWSAGNIFSSAWNGLVVFGRGIANFFIWLGVFIPVWIALGLVVWGVIRYRRRKKA